MSVEHVTGMINANAANNNHNSNPSTFSQIICMEIAA